MDSPGPVLRVIGAGRAGASLWRALTASGWRDGGLLGRGADVGEAAAGADLLVLAVPDSAVADVARSVTAVATTAVAHMAGALGLDVLAPHVRRASVHPLVAMPSAEVGAARLRAGAWFAVAGDPIAEKVVSDLGGRAVVVADEDRVLYHAAAVIASNHLVALLGQVERVAGRAGVPLEAYLDLVRSSVENVTELGPAAALTGPVARGDWSTVQRHRAALPPEELALYDALVAACATLRP